MDHQIIERTYSVAAAQRQFDRKDTAHSWQYVRITGGEFVEVVNERE